MHACILTFTRDVQGEVCHDLVPFAQLTNSTRTLSYMAALYLFRHAANTTTTTIANDLDLNLISGRLKTFSSSQ